MNLRNRFSNNLYDFYRLITYSQFSNPKPAPHIRILAHKLMELSLNKGKNRLAVSLPPRHSKSSMVTLAYPLWLIFNNPNLSILIVTGSGLTERFGITIRELIEKFGHEFNVYLSQKKHASTHIMFCDEYERLYNGTIKLTTAGGGITGQDADYLIVDDPYKGLDEEFTPTALQKKIDWANRVLEQRIEPHTKYCILHTRWHTNDLIGYYHRTQKEDFDFVTFPALNSNNEPLWKENYKLNDILKKKNKLPPRVFSSVYQQQPMDTTSFFFDMDKIKNQTLPHNDEIQYSIRAWDIASSSEISNGDYTSGALVSVTNNENYIVHDLVHGRFGNNTWNIIKNTAIKDTCKIPIGIETGVAGAGKLLYAEWEKQLEGFNVEQLMPITSKEDRATPLSNVIYDNHFYLQLPTDAYETLYHEFNAFPFGEHDDIVDSVAHAINYLKHRVNRVKPKADLVYIDL